MLASPGKIVNINDQLIVASGSGRISLTVQKRLAAAHVPSQVQEECVKAGRPAESLPYLAHLTLARARARDGARLPELPTLPRLQPWWADRLVLYSSRLARTGAVYEAMKALTLG